MGRNDEDEGGDVVTSVNMVLILPKGVMVCIDKETM